MNHIPTRHIAAGYGHSAVVSISHQLYVFGTSINGENSVPQLMQSITGKVLDKVSLGDQFGAAINSSGEVYTWGTNENGELGLGNFDPQG